MGDTFKGLGDINTKWDNLLGTFAKPNCDNYDPSKNVKSAIREDAFTNDESIAFSKILNYQLKDDEDCKKYLPLDPETNDLFNCQKDGIVLCKLINLAEKGNIDERVINKKDGMDQEQMNENITLAVNASKSIGCQVKDLTPETITNQKYEDMLDLLWQILKVYNLPLLN